MAKNENQTSLDDSYSETLPGVGFSRALPNTGGSETFVKKKQKKKRPSVSLAERPVSAASLGFVVTTDPQLILPQNPRRSYLLIQNKGVGTIYMAFGINPKINGINTVEIAPGGNYELDRNCPINDIYVVSSSTSNVSVQQGTKV